VPIQLAQCRFSGQVTSYLSNKIYGSNFIKQHSECNDIDKQKMSSTRMPQFGLGRYRGRKFSIDFGLGLDGLLFFYIIVSRGA